jgi:hypothetical protein
MKLLLLLFIALLSNAVAFMCSMSAVKISRRDILIAAPLLSVCSAAASVSAATTKNPLEKDLPKEANLKFTEAATGSGLSTADIKIGEPYIYAALSAALLARPFGTIRSWSQPKFALCAFRTFEDSFGCCFSNACKLDVSRLPLIS